MARDWCKRNIKHAGTRFIVILIALVLTGILIFYLTNFIPSIKDDSAKATIIAGLVALLGGILTVVHGEISAYYKDRSDKIRKKWDLIFPFIKSDYYPWINSARSFVASLDNLNPTNISDEAIMRVQYLTLVFFGYRLRFIINDGGLILLSSDKEEKTVMSAYRNVERSFQFGGEETPRRISHLQNIFLSKSKPNSPYVLAKFAQDMKKDTVLKENNEKLKVWLSSENIEELRKALNEFADCFKDAVDKLYTAWGD